MKRAAVHTTQMAIIETLLYYDIFDYPLTSDQLYYFLMYVKPNREEFDQVLDELVKAGRVQTAGYWYCLPGRQELEIVREQREQRANKLLHAAERAADRIRHLPFVRGIYLSGDLSKGVAGPDSDIDFFIITAPRRVWICKAYLASFRRKRRNNPDKLLCFNYLLAENAMELEEKNLFTAAEVVGLIPLSGVRAFRRFLHANDWIAAYFPRYRHASHHTDTRHHGRSRKQKWRELIYRNPLGDLLDILLLWLWKMAWSIKYRNKPDTRAALMKGIHRTFSKSHGYPTDREILAEYARRLQRIA